MPATDLILVVDDEADLRDTVCYLLTDAGYRATGAADGEAMRRCLIEHDVALIILDIGLGDESGLELALEVRKMSDVPIIMLTAKRAETDRVVGLELGADDYVTKPYSSAELVARVNSVLRRTRKSSNPSKKVAPKREIARFDGWELDLTARTLRSPDGRDVPLTAGEFDLLDAFVTHPDHVLSRAELLQKAARDGTVDRSIDVQILRLRRKIEYDPNAPRYIKAIRSVGYVFAMRVEWD